MKYSDPEQAGPETLSAEQLRRQVEDLKRQLRQQLDQLRELTGTSVTGAGSETIESLQLEVARTVGEVRGQSAIVEAEELLEHQAGHELVLGELLGAVLVPVRRQGAAEVPLHDVSGRIEELLAQQQVDEVLSGWLKELRAQANIRVLNAASAASKPMSTSVAQSQGTRKQ